ncbi:MAG: hypothetical protein HN639_00265, partial [Candidatus Thioglobus sp.]|nr:hypothetical protein [Candidatus Thioglobus sp.]MBT5286393.1 hypothetical protein [Candidatus Thioglobus sp.]MBT7497967.1 hypothetical protein [Candidatus Thioglobus sp.]
MIAKLVGQSKSLISDSEKIAMECGDTHWEKQLFTNQLKWDELLAVKSEPLSDEEWIFIKHKVSALCATFNKFGLSDKTLTQIKSEGFWALNIPKQYAGLEFSAKAHAKILTLLSSCDVSLA